MTTVTSISRPRYPPAPLYTCSIFTRVFSNPSGDPHFIGNYPAEVPAYVDAATGSVLTRSRVKVLALELGWGLTRAETVLSGKQTPRLKRGDVVQIFSANSLAYPVAMFGAIAAGLCCALANSAYTATELAHQFTDSGAKIILTSAECFATVREMFIEVLGIKGEDWKTKVILLPDDFEWVRGSTESSPASLRHSRVDGAAEEVLHMEELLGIGAMAREERFDGALAHETAFMCYSSGTTGKPKGVETTHQNAITLLDMVFHLAPLVHGQDSLLAMLPFFHIYGAVHIVLFSLCFGLKCVIMPRFEPVQYCASIERYRITLAMVVPPVLVVLARHPAVDQYDLSSLKYILSGAAPLGASLVEQIRERLLSKRKSGSYLSVTQGYGLTETSAATHMTPFWFEQSKPGTVGVLLGNLQARIVEDESTDDTNARDVVDGQPGELWIKGPSIMKGYLNRPTATSDSITANGYFKTGDVAIRDQDGFYYIVDRKKELIKYKGFQVPPAELESVLLTHPDIADAAVIGVDDVEEATELPRAYVVHAQPSAISSKQSQARFTKDVSIWIQSKVARHKYLRGGVVIIDVIPKSASGKILRRELRELAKKEIGTIKAIKSKAKL